jgi:hypothetical protein
MFRRYSDDELRQYATDMGISIGEARREWQANDRATVAYAKANGISFDDAETILARKEAKESGLLFAMAKMIEENETLFEAEDVAEAKRLRNETN